MQDFKEIFEKYGADYETTMTRFMGNETMYLKFLDMFFQDQNMQKLDESVKQGELRAAFEAAHTLKGVAANMGLTPFYDAVCVMVEPLRANEQRDDYTVLFQKLQEEFQRVEALRDELKGIA